MTSTTTPAMLSPQEVHERTGLALQTLANWRSKGQGPTWAKLTGEINRVGGIVGYPEDALQEWLDSRGVTATQLKHALHRRRLRRVRTRVS
jgi:predicted DNA-binding transcriptional regulator AlpA